MKAAGSVERFLAAPIGHWIAGRSFLVWNWSPQLGGSALWGRPLEDDFDLLFALVDAYHRAVGGCDVVSDVSRIQSIDATSYAALLERMGERLPFFATSVRRHAVVRSEGLLGGLAEGFFPLLGARHTWRIFHDAGAAFAWFDQPGTAAVCLEVERLVGEACHIAPQLRQVRDFLGTRLAHARLPDAARALGVSERTLHRQLRQLGTSFREELAMARVDAARRLLVETDLKIEAIARRVGCCSHAHLTTLFRRTTRQGPAEYRAQVRPVSADARDRSPR